MPYQIKKHHGRYNITRRTAAVRYIVVHYVGAGTSAVGSANANCRYFAGGNRNASAHYFIDDGSIWEYADPRAYATWHVGDGRGRFGITNANSVGIEVCNNGGPFTEAEVDRLRWLVRKLMADFGVPASRVVRHYDASRKTCPAYYARNPAEWTGLRARITGGAAKPAGPGKVDVDGYWGASTTAALQEALGTPVDGTVSSQDKYWRPRNPALTTGWQWVPKPKGSPLVKAMQREMGVKADGLIGPKTVNALIKRYEGKSGATICDGKLDARSATVKAMQRELNKGRF